MHFPKAPVKVAVTQLEPAWFDLENGIEKSIKYIEEAAREGAQLVVFPECWIPGYPEFVWANTFKDNLPMMKKYFENSLELDSPQFLRIRQAAKDNDIFVMFGFSERSNGSLYMAQALVDSQGEVVLHRHKTKPTGLERTIFGEGTGNSIRNVAETPLGNIGALQCWEHLQPLLKYHTIAQHEHLHIAAWPACHEKLVGYEPWSFSRAAAQVASQTYSLESGAYTLVASQCHAVADAASPGGHMAQLGGGLSAVYGPDGALLTKEVPAEWEGLLYASCDWEKIRFAKSFTDAVGHYSRPDLLRLTVDAEKKNFVTYSIEPEMCKPALPSLPPLCKP